jgi:hypothetical protein
LVSFKHVPPHSTSQHRIAFHKALVIRGNQTAPLDKQVFQVAVPNGPCGHAMEEKHFVFSSVREVLK